MKDITYLESRYEELGVEIKGEKSKASQILGFLSILVWVGMGRLKEIGVIYRIIVVVLLAIIVSLLLYNVAGKGFLGHPNNPQKEVTEKLLQKNYAQAHSIFKQTLMINNIAIVLSVVLFFFMLLLFAF